LRTNLQIIVAMNYFHRYFSGEELVRLVWFGWWLLNTFIRQQGRKNIQHSANATTLPEKSSWPVRSWGLAT